MTDTQRGQDSRFTVETELETDGRWIAEISQVPGALAYGVTKEEAVNKAYAIALRSIADDVEHSTDDPPGPAIGAAPNPFSKGYKNRHGKPVSDACGDEKHFECTQDLTKCHCKVRSNHNDPVAPHAYVSFPRAEPAPPQPAAQNQEELGSVVRNDLASQQVDWKIATEAVEAAAKVELNAPCSGDKSERDAYKTVAVKLQMQLVQNSPTAKPEEENEMIDPASGELTSVASFLGGSPLKANPCKHDRLDEEGFCRRCGKDCRVGDI